MLIIYDNLMSQIIGFRCQVSGFSTFGASYETSFKITDLPPGTKTQRDDMYFNLGALES